MTFAFKVTAKCQMPPAWLLFPGHWQHAGGAAQVIHLGQEQLDVPAPTNHEREELEDPLRGLLAVVVGLRREDLLAGVLGHHQQHGQHQVGQRVVPPDGRLPVDQREQPIARALRIAGPRKPSLSGVTRASPLRQTARMQGVCLLTGAC